MIKNIWRSIVEKWKRFWDFLDMDKEKDSG